MNTDTDPHPNRLQLAEKFPARYAVSAYPNLDKATGYQAPGCQVGSGSSATNHAAAYTTAPLYNCKNSRDCHSHPDQWHLEHCLHIQHLQQL
jgi:hypothetical protein